MRRKLSDLAILALNFDESSHFRLFPVAKKSTAAKPKLCLVCLYFESGLPSPTISSIVFTCVYLWRTSGVLRHF